MKTRISTGRFNKNKTKNKWKNLSVIRCRIHPSQLHEFYTTASLKSLQFHCFGASHGIKCSYVVMSWPECALIPHLDLYPPPTCLWESIILFLQIIIWAIILLEVTSTLSILWWIILYSARFNSFILLVLLTWTSFLVLTPSLLWHIFCHKFGVYYLIDIRRGLWKPED